MLVLTPALLYALLFSSVPVLSHAIPSSESSAIQETEPRVSSLSQESNVVRIAIKLDSEDSDGVKAATCDGKESSCEGGSTKRYGFRCGKKFFNQDQVLRAAKAACPRISKNSQRHIFPAPYTFSDYPKPGPYVQWPIKRNGRFWNMARFDKHRLVMTMDCSVVGAVIRDDDDDDDEEDYQSRKSHGITYKQCRYERQ